MRTVQNCDTYSTGNQKEVPYLETSVIHNAEKQELVVFAVNRSLEEEGIRIHTIPCAELSRGRGGPRCMSMPLWRENP